MTVLKPILIEGYTPEEILGLPPEQFKTFPLTISHLPTSLVSIGSIISAAGSDRRGVREIAGRCTINGPRREIARRNPGRCGRCACVLGCNARHTGRSVETNSDHPAPVVEQLPLPS